MVIAGMADSASGSSANSQGQQQGSSCAQQEDTKETSSKDMQWKAVAGSSDAQSTPTGASGGGHPQAGSFSGKAAAEGIARLPESRHTASEVAGSRDSDSRASEAEEYQGSPSDRAWWEVLSRWLGLRNVVPGSSRKPHDPGQSAASTSRHMASAKQGSMHEENLPLPSERRAAEGALLTCLSI